MNTLPSLSAVLSGHVDLSKLKTEFKNVQENIVEQPVLKAEHSETQSLSNDQMNRFTPIKVIGRIDLQGHLASKPGYAWASFKKVPRATDNISDMEEQKPAYEEVEVMRTKNQGEDKSTTDGKDNFDSHNVDLEEEHNEDPLDDFQNKPWMQDPKTNK